jgi:hypothetical protein
MADLPRSGLLEQVLDRTPYSDQSNERLLDRRTAAVSAALGNIIRIVQFLAVYPI